MVGVRPDISQELITPRIAPLCDPLGSPIRIVEPDFPLFLCGDGPMGVKTTIGILFHYAGVAGSDIILLIISAV